ncbi:MAG: ATP-binding protein [Proteobacteria bacterium]|nr:ATP-binding protein [Pseudomonadota bacterium]
MQPSDPNPSLLALQILAAQTSDGVVITGDDGVIRFVNPAAVEMLQRPSGELIGRRFEYFTDAPEGSRFDVVGAGGRQLIAERRSIPIEWQGEPATMTLLRDITDRKTAEQLRARLIHSDKLASIGQLCAGVAHEINNPATYVMANLTVMGEHCEVFDRAIEHFIHAAAEGERGNRAYMGIVAEYGLPERLQEIRAMLAESTTGMERIRGIASHLRAFSRIDRDVVERVDLNEVVQTACRLTRNEVRHRARLIQSLGPIPHILGDRGKLSQVLINLILNAVQAIEAGRAEENRIEIETARVGGEVTISVKDTGSGIPQDIQQRIFEPFFTTKPEDQGTGLGLSLSVELVETHGGRIEVSSRVGQGSRFTVSLPIDSHLIPQEAGSDTGELAGGRRLAHRILLVDDDSLVRRAIHRMLDDEYEVAAFSSAREALDHLHRDASFAVVLCDLMMPEMDGPGFYGKLATAYPHLDKRVLFISGGVFAPHVKEFLARTGLPVLEKPMSREKLIRTIDRIVKPIYPAEP